MKTKELNLEPLRELLTKYVNPDELAEQMDELAYDYFRVSVYAQFACNHNEKSYMSAEAGGYIYWIKELRDALKECAKGLPE